MHPTPRPTRTAPLADSRIVKKVRRDNAAHAYHGALLGEETPDYLVHPGSGPRPLHPLDFGRPGL